jgi:N-acylneuraminate cytidylyltransferase
MRPFMGKPIIDYSIEVAHKSGLFDLVVVSTDDSRIGGHATHLKCHWYKRSPELCQDHVSMVDVVIDVLRAQGTEGLQYDYVCMMYACAPFMRVETVVEGFKKLKQGGFDVTFPVYRGPAVERALFPRGAKMVSRFPQHDEEPSNLWPASYFIAGQFFWARRTPLIVNHTFMMDNRAGLSIPEAEAVDIDEPEDWETAELKYRMMQERGRV